MELMPLHRRTLSLVVVFWLLALAAWAGAARAQEPRLTVRALGSTVPSLAGTTSAAAGNQFLGILEKKEWYGLDIDLRLQHGVSLDLGASVGRLQEVLHTFPQPGGPKVVTRRTSSVRHNTLSLLFHPLWGRKVDLYFGPTIGQALWSRAFAANESERVEGGKVGFDVALGDSQWLFAGALSILAGDLRVLDFTPKHNVKYTVVGAGLGYRW
ncbi:MAG TPA: hypothetical protein VOA87_03345 [Thermoanaerobaculia bacterium]|nr:hypothetical protein [Thermoanaerobaculia bacterium]